MHKGRLTQTSVTQFGNVFITLQTLNNAFWEVLL